MHAMGMLWRFRVSVIERASGVPGSVGGDRELFLVGEGHVVGELGGVVLGRVGVCAWAVGCAVRVVDVLAFVGEVFTGERCVAVSSELEAESGSQCDPIVVSESRVVVVVT